jgi:phosphoribosylformylglycinamidine synthase
MPNKIKALIITGYGTNCEMEMAHACRLSGADAQIAHLSDILSGTINIPDYDFLNLPGGFLDGDDLGSAMVESVRLKHAKIKSSGRTMFDEIMLLIERGGIVLGVCNGFQALVKTGLLPGNPFGKRMVSLSFNDSARFEDRWVRVVVNKKSPCIFTKGLDYLDLPVRHGEGKIITDTQSTLDEISKDNLDCLYYADESGKPTMEYPANPNGSINAIAGLCDSTGRVFGLMPHPEAFTHFTNHPQWTRGIKKEPADGMLFFDNAVRFLTGNR